ncbi:MAG: stage IV sporulation protein A, partial [Anaerovoracaceae bacterium]
MKNENAFHIYNDIKNRTNGNIYIGIVGPARTGKSTFIRRFTEQMVLPFVEDASQSARIRDELPQSGGGRTVMTTEPKFVPAEAVTLKLTEESDCSVRLIDCVGYMVDGALGVTEGDQPRMISTPWSQDPISFEEAAAIGTRKVITEHSTIGIVITTDGSIGDIPRSAYVDAERQVIHDLKSVHKPFVIVLNSTRPYDDAVLQLASELEQTYEAPVIPGDCLHMDVPSIRDIILSTLYQFPASRISFRLPGFITGLPLTHPIKSHIVRTIRGWSSTVETLRDAGNSLASLSDGSIIRDVSLVRTDPGTGEITLEMNCENGLFYQVLGEIMECEVHNDTHFFQLIREFAEAKRSYDKLKEALSSVEDTGYGIVRPRLSEMKLDRPEVFRQGSRFGVRLKAHAPSLHIIRTEVTTEIAPVVGTESQSEDLVRYLNQEFADHPDRIWDTKIFGRTLYEMVTDQINSKLNSVPEELQFKVKRSLQRIS